MASEADQAKLTVVRYAEEVVEPYVVEFLTSVQIQLRAMTVCAALAEMLETSELGQLGRLSAVLNLELQTAPLLVGLRDYDWESRDNDVARESLGLAGVIGVTLVKANCPDVAEGLSELLG